MPRTRSLSEVRARWAVRKDDGEAEATSAENEGITYLATGEETQDVDLGDFIGVTGRVIASLRGGLSVMASEWVIAAKSLRPLPVAFAEMNEETRVR